MTRFCIRRRTASRARRPRAGSAALLCPAPPPRRLGQAVARDPAGERRLRRGRDRARDGPAAGQGARAAGRDREPAGRRRHHRDVCDRQGPPDGQTIGVLSNNHVINPSVFKTLPYDTLADITPIMVVGDDAVRARRQSGQAAGQEREGAGGAAEGEAGRLQLRVVGQRDDPPSRRRAVRRRGGRGHQARSLQGRRADGLRPDRRTRRPGRRRRAVGAGPPQVRGPAGHRRRGQTRIPQRRTCRRSPSRVCPTTSSADGSPWSAPPSCLPPR